MTAPYLSGPWYPPLRAPVACGEIGLDSKSSSDEEGA